MSVQSGLGLAPRCPSPARLLSSAPRLRWASGGDGEESGVESRRPMFPMGRNPDPRDPSSTRRCSLRPDLLRVRLQSQRRGARPVSATRDPDPSLAPCSPPLGAEDGERGCAPSGRGPKRVGGVGRDPVPGLSGPRKSLADFPLLVPAPHLLRPPRSPPTGVPGEGFTENRRN